MKKLVSLSLLVANYAVVASTISILYVVVMLFINGETLIHHEETKFLRLWGGILSRGLLRIFFFCWLPNAFIILIDFALRKYVNFGKSFVVVRNVNLFIVIIGITISVIGFWLINTLI